MNMKEVHSHLVETKKFLIRTSEKLALYLDEYNLKSILRETESDRYRTSYIRQLFKQLRRMEVLCDEASARVHHLLRSEHFPQLQAEKILYKVYEQCIMEFYSPHHDLWYEESRAVYSNQVSIKFHQSPPATFKKLFEEIEPGFQNMREILDYYEMKYQAQ